MIVTDMLNDIYYQSDYASLYSDNDSEVFNFTFRQDENKIHFHSIKRPINFVAGQAVDGDYFDLETPYGYGGPVTNCHDKDFLSKAFKAYRVECQSQNIVCEFIRFHPFNPIMEHNQLFDFYAQERQVVIVDLSLPVEERWAKYSKTTRNILRKANKKLNRISDSKILGDFYSLYQQTMDKNNAAEFYYFKPEYFNKLIAINNVDLLSITLDSEVVSTGFFMYGNELAHYHLSANNSDFLSENGNYALLDYAFDQAKEYGCKWMMLGGGRTSDEMDSLFKFKKKFSDKILPFYIGGVTFLPQIREQLNQLWYEKHTDSTQRLFQQYRL